MCRDYDYSFDVDICIKYKTIAGTRPCQGIEHIQYVSEMKGRNVLFLGYFLLVHRSWFEIVCPELNTLDHIFVVIFFTEIGLNVSKRLKEPRNITQRTSIFETHCTMYIYKYISVTL